MHSIYSFFFYFILRNLGLIYIEIITPSAPIARST